MNETPYRLVDAGNERVLTVDGQEYRTCYSERLIRMLIARKGPRRAALYFGFKKERGEHFLGPLFRYLETTIAAGLRVLEVGCSFGHNTEYLVERPAVAEIHAFDTDPDFVAMVDTKVDEMRLGKVREVKLLSNEESCRLPWANGAFDLVLVVGIVEHLSRRYRRVQVDEYYRVLAPGGHIAILDTPNRWFPYETHSIGLPLVQWMPAWLAYPYARTFRPGLPGVASYADFTAEGSGWQNATLGDCLPSWGLRGLEDLTEQAGYGWRFFRDTARSRSRQGLLPAFTLAVGVLDKLGRSPSLCLPYFNLLFRRSSAAMPGV